MNNELPNPMLTLITADCACCGATSETVQRDRELLPSADRFCCDIADLIRLDPREAYLENDDDGFPEPEFECWYCGDSTRSPFRIGNRTFCCKACGSGYAE